MSKPVKYKEIKGWLDYEDYYESVARAIPDNGVFVEVGVWKGRSICYFAEWCRILGKNVTIYGVDKFGGLFGPTCKLTWGDEGIDHVQANLETAGVSDMITLIQGDSASCALQFEDNSLDFVWLDADHTLQNLCREIMAWTTKLKPGGILAGHDLDNKSHPDVEKALKTMGVRYWRCSARSWASKKSSLT